MTVRHRLLVPLTLAAALGVASCGSDDSEGDTARPAADKPVTVPIREFKFVPPSLTVTAPAMVTFINEDRAPHTATVTGGGFDSGTLEQGQRGAIRISRAGTYAYVCELHPYMKGTIVAR